MYPIEIDYGYKEKFELKEIKLDDDQNKLTIELLKKLGLKETDEFRLEIGIEIILEVYRKVKETDEEREGRIKKEIAYMKEYNRRNKK